MDAFSVIAGNIISFLALILSGYATVKTVSFNRAQQKLLKNQEFLSTVDMKKAMEYMRKINKADVIATVEKQISGKYVILISNDGSAAAKDVNISFPDGDAPVPMNAINSKFPLETLYKSQSVELSVFLAMDAKRKHRLNVTWEDEELNEKEIFLTF
ncbi:hypothetical protein TMES_14540 [Thalassospira mesophila]|uniref:Uncharacterized protein n=2 Tax=Thalassospira mesophila TaxID=1293891 RepID=A0A1Y2L0T9_9PROT|nr:hypothetical protein TMES_14540 [Thalassospira mesophila]